MSDERYHEFMNRFMKGAAPTEEEFLYHFEHQKGKPTETPSVGADAPGFQLTDHAGRAFTLKDVMGKQGVLLVFARSAYWCPYCRNQLAELNVQLDRVRKAGFGIAAITPDAPERIRDFCTGNGIRYPILSDPDGVAIRAYGVLNDRIPANKLQGSGPLPQPGHFLISREGRVLAKEFTGDIRFRASATTLAAENSTSTDGGVTLASAPFEASIALSSAQAFGGQEIAVTAKFTVAPGFHVYGSEVAAPYTPIALAFAQEDGLVVEQRMQFPAGELLELEAVGETLSVLSGEFIARGRIRLRWSPPPSPFKGLRELTRRQAIMPGQYRIKGVVRYQACSDTTCLPPDEMPFELPLEIMPNAGAGAPVRLGDTIVPPPNF